jgi:hypothetical protein
MFTTSAQQESITKEPKVPQRSNMPPIVFLTCYFGPWPWYFPYFIRSCSFNPDIHFILISDNEQHGEIEWPENVKLIPTSLPEVKKQFDDRLGFETSILDSYKLCDFKPSYGYVFNNLIEGYAFWGHCDIDIVWGNISNFLLPDVLKNNDLITGRHDFLSGTFTLFRNCPQMNELFKESRSYPEVFMHHTHFCFDECNFLWKQIGELSNPADLSSVYYGVDSMTHVVRRKQMEGSFKAFFDFMILEGVPGNIFWRNGKLIYKNEFEVLLYHMIKFKKVNTPSPPTTNDFVSFRIGKKKFYNLKS